MSYEVKDFFFTYLEYLYSIRQSAILDEILSSKDHDAWSADVLVMIAMDEFDEIKKATTQNVMSLEELLNQIQILNREKKIDKIFDK